MILFAILICIAMSAIWFLVGFYLAKKRFKQEQPVIYCDPHNVVTLADKVKVSAFDPMLKRFGGEYLRVEVDSLRKRLAEEVSKYVDIKRIDDNRTNDIIYAASIKVLNTRGE